jgi:hypothetical protein
MERSITCDGFAQAVSEAAVQLAREVWQEVVDGERGAGADTWLRQRGGAFLREVLGAAWTARAERLGVAGACGCGGAHRFRQRRAMQLHTVLPGREVAVRLQYGQCDRCHGGVRPLLRDVGVDAEGFTSALQELAVLASVVEPYEAASGELLGRFAGVTVSTEKLQALVHAVAPAAAAVEAPEAPIAPEAGAPCVAIDGGMIFVDGRWQEVKLACAFAPEACATPETRPTLTARQVVAVRGTPDALAAHLWPRVAGLTSGAPLTVVVGDGAPWIWHLAAELFPRRVEVLDWYHADEHVSAVARTLYGDGTPKAAEWRQRQLDRLWRDGVDEVIEGLRFLGTHQRAATKRTAVLDLHRYLTTNRERMRYQTFRTAGYRIGSGAVESAVSHVVQQRMKRVGMRWRAAGADAMLALRAVYRSTGAWDQLWARNEPHERMSAAPAGPWRRSRQPAACYTHGSPAVARRRRRDPRHRVGP